MGTSLFGRAGAVLAALVLGLTLIGSAQAAPPSNFPPFDFEFTSFSVNPEREAVIRGTMYCARSGRVAVGVWVSQNLGRGDVTGISDKKVVRCERRTTTPLKFVVAAEEGPGDFRAGPLTVVYEFDGCTDPGPRGFGVCHQEIGFDRQIAPWRP